MNQEEDVQENPFYNVTATLNLFLDGNETKKVNTTAKLKLTIGK